MKLNRQPQREPRISSRDALAVDAAEPKPDFFDPRVDFPARELARLKQLARGENPQFTSLYDDPLNNGWWLSLVDPEFKQLLSAYPYLKDVLKLEFADFWRRPENQGKRPAYLLGSAGPIIQLHPALRNEIRKDYGDSLLPQLLDESRKPLLFGDKMKKLACLLQLYPERRAEWFENYEVHSDQVLQQLAVTLMESGILKIDKLELIANLLLVFPDLRSAILADVTVRNIASQMEKELKSRSRPFERYDFQVGFFLTVMGAEDACIDETGQIQLQLKPLPVKPAGKMLPTRPLA